jgi:hypothetical protein
MLPRARASSHLSARASVSVLTACMVVRVWRFGGGSNQSTLELSGWLEKERGGFFGSAGGPGCTFVLDRVADADARALPVPKAWLDSLVSMGYGVLVSVCAGSRVLNQS